MNYKGYERSDKVINWFWELMHENQSYWRMRIIQYIHGSFRFPHKRLNKANFTIVRDERDNKRLPYVSTCSSYMKLPNYTSKAELK